MNYCLIVFALAVAASGASGQESHESLRAVIKKAIAALDAVDRLVEERRNSSSVIGRIVAQGYEFFSQSSSLTKVNGLKSEFFDRFVDLTVPRFGIPPADQAEIKEKVFGKLKVTEPGQWVEHKMLFNPTTDPENTKYICIYGFVRPDNNFDLVMLEVKASFKLARDVLIIHNKLTGKITLEKEELETERLPSDIDKQDVQVVLKFFEATALRILSTKI